MQRLCIPALAVLVTPRLSGQVQSAQPLSVQAYADSPAAGQLGDAAAPMGIFARHRSRTPSAGLVGADCVVDGYTGDYCDGCHLTRLAKLAAGLAASAALGCHGPSTQRPAAGAAVDSATSSLPYVIVEPDPGTIWREGEHHVIRWSSRRQGTVNVGIAVGGKDKGHLALGIPAGADSLPWEVPVGFVTGFGPQRSDAVRVRIEDTKHPGTGVTSSPFTIAAGR